MTTRTPRGPWARQAGAYAAIAIFGLMAVLAPALGKPLMSAPLFPLLRTAVEHLGWETFAALGLLGLIAGGATTLPPAGIAAASVALLPLAAFAEIAADRTSHNLIPFELAMYAFMALPVFITAALARGVRGRLRPPAPGASAPR